jgi:hypothetical protein
MTHLENLQGFGGVYDRQGQPCHNHINNTLSFTHCSCSAVLKLMSLALPARYFGYIKSTGA